MSKEAEQQNQMPVSPTRDQHEPTIIDSPTARKILIAFLSVGSACCYLEGETEYAIQLAIIALIIPCLPYIEKMLTPKEDRIQNGITVSSAPMAGSCRFFPAAKDKEAKHITTLSLTKIKAPLIQVKPCQISQFCHPPYQNHG